MSLVLTPRQREFLQHVARGKSAKVIAWELDVSLRTVETTLMHARMRNSAPTTTRLVVLAIRDGLIQP